MARIAYVDHSYHQKTLSTQFIPDILRRRGHTVDLFWDEEWKGGRAVPFSLVADYDAVIMFQCRCASAELYFRRLHPNVIYIPMLDSFGIAAGPVFNMASHWEPFKGCKVINFSSALHGITAAFGLRSLYIRYYQAPVLSSPPVDGLRGFFWIRHEAHVSWPMVRALLGETAFTRLHIHIAPDPGSPAPTLPSEEEMQKYNITTSTWFENKKDLLDILEQSNVYFAPRREEGIGQSFLEAMAGGLCVIAPDNGTMNEYILHGLNGLLYNTERPAPLDFSHFAELGEAARQSVASGYERWCAAEDCLENFILTPCSETYCGLYQGDSFSPLPLKQWVRNLAFMRKTERYWRPVWRRIKALRT